MGRDDIVDHGGGGGEGVGRDDIVDHGGGGGEG